MTELMQLSFQCDADLGGNLDNGHSQKSYLGYLAGSLICWCSTDQGTYPCVTSSQVTHITRGLRHLDLAQFWIKEKVADGTCVVIKIASKDNNADIGTKRLLLPLFNALSYKLVDKTLRKNL